jgi:hypothetical protein
MLSSCSYSVVKCAMSLGFSGWASSWAVKRLLEADEDWTFHNSGVHCNSCSESSRHSVSIGTIGRPLSKPFKDTRGTRLLSFGRSLFSWRSTAESSWTIVWIDCWPVGKNLSWHRPSYLDDKSVWVSFCQVRGLLGQRLHLVW